MALKISIQTTEDCQIAQDEGQFYLCIEDSTSILEEVFFNSIKELNEYLLVATATWLNK